MKRSNFWAALWETLETILIAVIAVYLVRSFIFQPFLVSGASMEPNFSTHDYLIIDEASYLIRQPARGEVIVFQYPKQPSVFFIKRIIGLPGETVLLDGSQVGIVDDGQTTILNEDYLRDQQVSYGKSEIKLGQGEYFVMGDNRNNSYDSRNWGSLSRSYIVGIARLRLWPVTKAGIFE